jgi:hypothetical protein
MEGSSPLSAGWQFTNMEGLVILLVILTLIYLFAARARAGKSYVLRRIEGFEAIRQAVGQAAELGKPIHMSLGTGGIGKSNTLETFAGLNALEYLAQQAALCNTPLIVNVADPTSLPAAQAAIFRAYAQAGYPEEYNANKVRFLAPDPVAYAAGVMSTLEQEKLAANIMIGSFGDEFLLMSEIGNQKNISQVGGTTNPRVLPAVYISTEHTLIGEEIFAVGAYLLHDPNHIGALVAQDVMRVAIVFTVLVGIILKTLGVL